MAPLAEIAATVFFFIFAGLSGVTMLWTLKDIIEFISQILWKLIIIVGCLGFAYLILANNPRLREQIYGMFDQAVHQTVDTLSEDRPWLNYVFYFVHRD